MSRRSDIASKKHEQRRTKCAATTYNSRSVTTSYPSRLGKSSKVSKNIMLELDMSLIPTNMIQGDVSWCIQILPNKTVSLLWIRWADCALFFPGVWTRGQALEKRISDQDLGASMAFKEIQRKQKKTVGWCLMLSEYDVDKFVWRISYMGDLLPLYIWFDTDWSHRFISQHNM